MQSFFILKLDVSFKIKKIEPGKKLSSSKVWLMAAVLKRIGNKYWVLVDIEVQFS